MVQKVRQLMKYGPESKTINELLFFMHMFFFVVAPDLARKMRRKKIAPEARKQRRALEKLKLMSKQAKHCS